MYSYIRKEKPVSVDLAEKLVKEMYNHDLDVNIIDLHNYLFILWCKYFRETGDYLYGAEPFIATSTGPRLLSVRDRFCLYPSRVSIWGWGEDVEEDPWFAKNIEYIKKLRRNSFKVRDIVKTKSWKKFYDKKETDDYWAGGIHEFKEDLKQIPFSYIVEEVDNILNQVDALP